MLLHLREDYEQAVLDLFEADQEAKEVRPELEVVGHTSNFLDNDTRGSGAIDETQTVRPHCGWFEAR